MTSDALKLVDLPKNTYLENKTLFFLQIKWIHWTLTGKILQKIVFKRKWSSNHSLNRNDNFVVWKIRKAFQCIEQLEVDKQNYFLNFWKIHCPIIDTIQTLLSAADVSLEICESFHNNFSMKNLQGITCDCWTWKTGNENGLEVWSQLSF